MQDTREHRFQIAGKKVRVFPAEGPDAPVIYANLFMDYTFPLRHALEKEPLPDYSLVTISNLEWDHDMAPWDIPSIAPGDTPCTAGADDYLKVLLQEISPKAESVLPGTPSWRGLAGYSLAGLFATYAPYRTDVFSRIASMSGSLWFPNFLEFTQTNEMEKNPDHIYFSLGDREAKTRNPYLQPVQKNTEQIVREYQEKGIHTVFELKPGNHGLHAERRTAEGIAWILQQD